MNLKKTIKLLVFAIVLTLFTQTYPMAASRGLGIRNIGTIGHALRSTDRYSGRVIKEIEKQIDFSKLYNLYPQAVARHTTIIPNPNVIPDINPVLFTAPVQIVQPVEIPAAINPSIPLVPTSNLITARFADISESLKALSEKLTASNVLIGAASLGVAAAAIYSYQKSKELEEEDVDSAISFVFSLIKDPYNQEIINNTNLAKYLATKNENILKVLSLKNAIFNLNTYVDLPEDSSLKRVFNTEYQEVKKLFILLSEILEFNDQTNLETSGNRTLKNNIRKQANKIYIYLLKAKSTLPTEKRKAYEFTDLKVFKEAIKPNENINNNSLNIDTVDYIIAQITGKIGTYDDKEIKKLNPDIFRAFNIFKEYQTKPSKWHEEHATHTRKSVLSTEIQDEEYRIKETLLGNLSGYFTSFNQDYLNREKKLIDLFYSWIKKSVGQGESPAVENKIRSYAHYLMFLTLRHLSLNDKLSLIEDYLLTQINKAIEISEPEAAAAKQETTKQRLEQERETRLKRESYEAGIGKENPWA